MKRSYGTLVLTLLLASGSLSAQQVFQWRFAPGQTSPENLLGGGLSGRWWTKPAIVQRLGLTPEQQKKMDEVFQQSRIQLIDLTASLDKAEAVLEPLVEADQPDAAKIRVQIDRIADARAGLEKANANMLLGLRLILTPEQWKIRQANGRGGRRGMVNQFLGAPTAPPAAAKKQQ